MLKLNKVCNSCLYRLLHGNCTPNKQFLYFFFNFVLVAGNFLGVSVAKSSEILVSLRSKELDTLEK